MGVGEATLLTGYTGERMTRGRDRTRVALIQKLVACYAPLESMDALDEVLGRTEL